MDRVRTRHFLADCAALAGDLHELKSDFAAEAAAFEANLRATHGELKAKRDQG